MSTREELVAGVREAIYETYRDRNPTLETAETGPQWSLEPGYRQDDFTAMAEAAVDVMMDHTGPEPTVLNSALVGSITSGPGPAFGESLGKPQIKDHDRRL